RANGPRALPGGLPPLPRGAARPRADPERLGFGQWCNPTERHPAAARLWAEAMETDPRLANDLRAAHRYHAAHAAALAGCGQGRDDPPPDDAARARLRGQAPPGLPADPVRPHRPVATEPR